MALSMPWLIAECEQEDCQRVFLCDGSAEASAFIEHAPVGRLLGLVLVLTPGWSDNGDWQFARVARVERDLRSVQKPPYSLVFLTVNGVRYSGSPLEPFAGDGTGCVTVLEFQNEQSASPI